MIILKTRILLLIYLLDKSFDNAYIVYKQHKTNLFDNIKKAKNNNNKTMYIRYEYYFITQQ